MRTSAAIRFFRRRPPLFAGAAVAVAVALSGAPASAAPEGAAPERPRFVGEPLRAPHVAPVREVLSELAADVVILEGGLARGLRTGMVCAVRRDARPIGELLLIESRSARAAALILDLAEGASIRPGDIAKVKTLRTR